MLAVCPLYGALAADAQLKVFEPAPTHARKVILATNIAETSLTINGIKFVIDTGHVKQRVYNPRTGLDTLAVMPVSQAQAGQRTGRAGRESAGTCYRLYQELAFDGLPASTTPEILRGNLSTVVLQLLTMGVPDVLEFDYMDPPSRDSLVAALELLFDLDAIDKAVKLTDCGRLLAQFPLEPKLAQVVLASAKYGCGMATSTSFWTISRAFLSSLPAHTRRVACLTYAYRMLTGARNPMVCPIHVAQGTRS